MAWIDLDYHLITSNGVFLIHQDSITMRKTKDDIDSARRAFILSGKPILPTGRCLFCDFSVPPRVLYCDSACAREFLSEREALAARKPTGA